MSYNMDDNNDLELYGQDQTTDSEHGLRVWEGELYLPAVGLYEQYHVSEYRQETPLHGSVVTDQHDNSENEDDEHVYPPRVKSSKDLSRPSSQPDVTHEAVNQLSSAAQAGGAKVSDRLYDAYNAGDRVASGARKGALVKTERSYKRRGRKDNDFPCNICNKTFNRQCDLNAHSRKHLPASQKPFQCGTDGCDKGFLSKVKLQIHEEIHNRPDWYFCPECLQAFKTHGKMRIHVEAHDRRNVLSCHDCEQIFDDEQQLRNHIDNRVCKDWYHCLDCDNYVRTVDRQQHIHVHSKEWDARRSHAVRVNNSRPAA